MGVGIPATLSPRYGRLDRDVSYVRLAMLPHVSGTFDNSAYSTMKDNAGLGLFFIKEIASRSGGALYLASRKGMVDIWMNPEGFIRKLYMGSYKSGWPGTFAYIILKKGYLEDFDGLLALCRSIAAEARRDPSTARIDFIDSIPDIDGIDVVKVLDFEEDVERASHIRENVIIPKLKSGEMVIMDFSGIRAATQSFVHACMYRILRDVSESGYALSICGCSAATKEAIMSVAAYAKVSRDQRENEV